MLRQQRYVRRNDTPSFRQAHPGLALASAHDGWRQAALKLQRYAAEIPAEAHDIQSRDGARKIRGGAALAESHKLFVAIEIFRGAETHDARIVPEEPDQSLHVVCHERLLVTEIERTQVGDNFRVIDRHRLGNNTLSGRISLLSAALTVCTGSFTTWLRRSRSATLHRI